MSYVERERERERAGKKSENAKQIEGIKKMERRFLKNYWRGLSVAQCDPFPCFDQSEYLQNKKTHNDSIKIIERAFWY